MKININFDEKPDRLYVGFSGGADSTALLLATLENGLNVRAVHFEHGIRGEESRADAAWCRAFCAARGVEYREIPLDTLSCMKPGENLEATARRLRLEAWQAFSGGKPTVILLGHHADDRVENMLIRLARGSNASGAGRMDYRSRFGNLTFLRPLLDCRREEIEQYLRDAGVNDWRIDSTNEDESYLRNFLRKMLPEWYAGFPPVREGLLHAARALTLDGDCLDAQARAEAEPLKTSHTPVGYWRAIHPALVPRLLRLWPAYHRFGEVIPNHHLIERFIREIHSESTETRYLEVNGELQIGFSRGEAWLHARENPLAEPLPWHWREQPEFMGFSAEPAAALPENGVAFDAALLPDVLEIAAPAPGDAMIPFGAHSPKKLKKLMLDAKFSARQKDELRVLRIPGGEIIWAPGLRRSNFAPVTEQTAETVVFRRGKKEPF
jgi:tRNA(Ile)-lysidine synthase